MQKVVGDRLRPAGSATFGVESALLLRRARKVGRRWRESWATAKIRLADCAAAPALFYAARSWRSRGFPEALTGAAEGAAELRRVLERPSPGSVFPENEPFPARGRVTGSKDRLERLTGGDSRRLLVARTGQVVAKAA